MQVAALDGRLITVRRVWMPWRLKKRDVGNPFGDPTMLLDAADDPAGLLIGLLFGLVLFIFGGIILTVFVFAGELVLLLLLLIPVIAIARILWIVPWVVEVSGADTVLGRSKVRGWRESEEKIRELASAYQRGEDPFAARE